MVAQGTFPEFRSYANDIESFLKTRQSAQSGSLLSPGQLRRAPGLSDSDAPSGMTVFGNGLININSAEARILDALFRDHSGSELSRRIIVERSMLAFRSVFDMKERMKLSADEFRSVFPMICVNSSWFRIRIDGGDRAIPAQYGSDCSANRGVDSGRPFPGVVPMSSRWFHGSTAGTSIRNGRLYCAVVSKLVRGLRLNVFLIWMPAIRNCFRSFESVCMLRFRSYHCSPHRSNGTSCKFRQLSIGHRSETIRASRLSFSPQRAMDSQRRLIWDETAAHERAVQITDARLHFHGFVPHAAAVTTFLYQLPIDHHGDYLIADGYRRHIDIIRVRQKVFCVTPAQSVEKVMIFRLRLHKTFGESLLIIRNGTSARSHSCPGYRCRIRCRAAPMLRLCRHHRPGICNPEFQLAICPNTRWPPQPLWPSSTADHQLVCVRKHYRFDICL